jgi:hypothetical protein
VNDHQSNPHPRRPPEKRIIESPPPPAAGEPDLRIPAPAGEPASKDCRAAAADTYAVHLALTRSTERDAARPPPSLTRPAAKGRSTADTDGAHLSVTRIDDLISREYLERDLKKANSYRFLTRLVEQQLAD